MEGPLKRLLEQAVRRANISGRVGAASIVEAARAALEELGFPSKDVRVISVRDGLVTVACRGAAAAHALRAKRVPFLDAIKRRIPGTDVRELTVRIGLPAV